MHPSDRTIPQPAAADNATVQLRPAPRPSRLSAVLVEPPAAPTALGSPPVSPTTAAAQNKAVINQQDVKGHAASGTPPTVAATAGKTAPSGSPPPGSLSATACRAGPAQGGSCHAATPAPAPSVLATPGLSPASPHDSSSDSRESEQDSDWSWESPTPWYTQPWRVAVILLLLASVGLVLAGLLLQVVFQDPDHLDRRTEEVFPILYFLAALPPLALALRWLCWRLYTAAEYTAIREELYFLRPLKRKLAGILFWMTVLLWFQACFSWLWCQDMCQGEAYQSALHAVWRLLICATLFAAANFLKCSIARLLSYSFYRTAHFAKVKEAIERELYLIRLSQARSTLLPPPASAQEPYRDIDDQHETHTHSVWGSTMWRKASQVLRGPGQCSVLQPTAAEGQEPDPAACVDAGTAPAQAAAARAGGSTPGGTAFQPSAGLGGLQQCSTGAMRHVASAGTIAGAEDAAVQVQVRCSSEALLKRHPGNAALATAASAPTDAATATVSPSAVAAAANLSTDSIPLLNPALESSSARTPKVSWLQADLLKAQEQQQHHQHQHEYQQPPQSSQAARQRSYELFTAERMPSILSSPHRSGTGSKGGSRSGTRVGQGSRTGRKLSSCSASRRVPLPGMVAGVGGLLLNPDMLATDGQAQRQGQPMTEEELSRLRGRLGVNTFGTFVDRYYGLTPKEEAAAVRQVKRFAKGLFANVLGDADRDHLLPEDFLLFFDGDEETAHDAFEYFDRNSDGSISCIELQDSAAEMLCERKNIAASIKDTDSVVNSLETGLGMLVHFVFIALYLLVWGVNIVQGFTTFSATALALTFVFGDSVKGVFESALYLFIQHPYDVGDALWLPPGILARVRRIDLQFTVLLRSDGQLVWHPNSTLRTQPLVNLSRSNPRWEGYTWLVDIDTSEEVLTQLQDALAAHAAAHRVDFSGVPSVMWRSMEDPLKMRLAVGVTYNFTGEDAGRYVAARHGLLAVVRRELHRLGVKYTVPVQQQAFMPLQQQQPTPLQ